jgi:hypothetical protein
MRKHAQNLKSIQDKRNLRRIGAEQDHTLNLHRKDSGRKSNERKNSHDDRIGILALALALGAGRQAQAQDAKTPYPAWLLWIST